MSASSPDEGATLVKRIMRKLAGRRLVTNLAMVGGYLVLLCNPDFAILGDCKLLLVLLVEILLFLVAIDCLEIYGGPHLFFNDKWNRITRWRRPVRRTLAILLVLCVAIMGTSAVFTHTK